MASIDYFSANMASGKYCFRNLKIESLLPFKVIKSGSYKYNYRREGVRVANARPKVIIFCKSRPCNCTCKENSRQLENLYPMHLVASIV